MAPKKKETFDDDFKTAQDNYANFVKDIGLVNDAMSCFRIPSLTARQDTNPEVETTASTTQPVAHTHSPAMRNQHEPIPTVAADRPSTALGTTARPGELPYVPRKLPMPSSSTTGNSMGLPYVPRVPNKPPTLSSSATDRPQGLPYVPRVVAEQPSTPDTSGPHRSSAKRVHTDIGQSHGNELAPKMRRIDTTSPLPGTSSTSAGAVANVETRAAILARIPPADKVIVESFENYLDAVPQHRASDIVRLVHAGRYNGRFEAAAHPRSEGA